MPHHIKIAVAGSGGRMGQSIIHVAEHTSNFILSERLHHDSTLEGLDADVLIDFTHPSALDKHIKACRDNNIALVIGTTGLTDTDEAKLKNASKDIAIVYSANMSIGVNVLSRFTEKLASVLDDTFDIEILEMHHRHKKDAPGGTALMLGRAAAKGRGIDFADNAVLSRQGETGPRKNGAIGFAVMRGGEIIGEHKVMYLGSSERIELSHKASDRSLFSKGALTAAKWAKDQPAGLYSMFDVLDL